MHKVGLAVLSVVLSVCATLIDYQVAARKDPFVTTDTSPTTFSFQSNSSARDPVLEKKLFQLVATTLESRGWKHDQSGGGEVVFRIEYAMDSKEVSGSRPVTTYNWSTKQYVVTQQHYQDTSYNRSVLIFAAKSAKPQEPFWSAECTSTGSKEDLLFAASHMVPYAMQRFPEEGVWRKREVAE